jgi:protease I
MDQKLRGKKVAILVADQFEQVEFTEPKKALEDAGAETVVVSPNPDQVKGWDGQDWGREFAVDLPLEEAKADSFDALLLPGGVKNPDTLRRDPRAVRFVRHFFEVGKPVAAICHGPWTLINAGVVRDRKMTSYDSIELDLRNAGADWVDREVVVDEGLVTSRNPGDIPAFNRKMIEEFAEGRHEEQRRSA